MWGLVIQISYDDWQQMIILFAGADSMQCALVEAYLIDLS